MKIEKEKKIKFTKVILLSCIYIIIGLCVLYNIIFSINTTITENDYFKLFGISFFNVKNDLMEGDMNKNDLVIVKEVEEKEIQEGDIIAYTVNGKTRINKIINKKQTYVTKSNKSYYTDLEEVTYNEIIGKKVVNIPYLGFLIVILQSKVTNIFILLFLILYLLQNKYMYTKKKERAIKKKRRQNG